MISSINNNRGLYPVISNHAKNVSESPSNHCSSSFNNYQLRANPGLLSVYFTSNKNPEKELQAILKEKVKASGKITPDMIDDRAARLLLDIAKLQTSKSYAPYSNYHVGAAVISEDGKIYKGCNVENSSYGLTLCAERSALSNMVADNGYRQIAAIAVDVKEAKDPAYSCGACRQWIEEFNKQEDAKIVLEDRNGQLVYTNIKELLPHSFGPKDLEVVAKPAT